MRMWIDGDVCVRVWQVSKRQNVERKQNRKSTKSVSTKTVHEANAVEKMSQMMISWCGCLCAFVF